MKEPNENTSRGESLLLCTNGTDIEPEPYIWPKELWGPLSPEEELYGISIWRAAVREVNEYCPEPI